MEKWLLALDFGGTKLSTGLIASGKVDWEAKKRIFTSAGTTARDEISLMLEMADRILAGRQPAGIGVSFGGPVNFARQFVRRSDHVPGWNDLPLPAILSGHFQAPVIMDNDANVAALGEYVYGAGQGSRALLYVTVSTGVGGGWILDGQVWRGAQGMAGEIGHIVVDPGGPICVCGKNGCVERLASGPFMAQDAVKWLQERPGEGKRLRQIMAEDGATGAAISRAAAEGDLLPHEILMRSAWALGIGLGNAANLVDPERIILGGGVTKAGPKWWDMVRDTAKMTMLPDLDCDIVPAGLDDDAPLWGAIALVQPLVSRE